MYWHMPAEAKRLLVEPAHPHLSVVRQCELLGLPRSSYYYEPAEASAEDLRLMGQLPVHSERFSASTSRTAEGYST
jgi:putative transposase